jgi:hypothetical protein
MALLLLPLSPLRGTVMASWPGCAALVQAQDPQTGEQAPEGYALVLTTDDGYGDELEPGDQVRISWPQGSDASQMRPVQVVRQMLGQQPEEVHASGLGWLDGATAAGLLSAQCGAAD